MTASKKENINRNKKDADRMGAFFNSTHDKPLFNNFIGVALSSYMNGINDAFKSFNAAKKFNREISQ